MNNIVSQKAFVGKNVTIKEGVIIEDNVVIGDGCYLDYNCIIRENVILGNNSYVGPACILGEYNSDFYKNYTAQKHPLLIGEHALIRSHSVIYGGSSIQNDLQTGHRVTIRENTSAGEHWRVGTLSDIQGDCVIGNYVNMHSNVHIAQGSKIGNYVWLFPYCITLNDPIPPSQYIKGVTIEDYAIIATGSILLPGVTIGNNALIAAGSLVTRPIEQHMMAVGSPAKPKCNISEIANHDTGEPAYPWPQRFSKYMPWSD